MQPIPPFRVLIPLGLAVCLSLFGDLTLYAVLVTQLDVVGLSLAAVGVMLGVNRLVRIPSNPVAGAMLDHWGRRWLFILGMLLGVLSTASYGLVHGFWPFLAGRLTWGIAWTLINVGGMAMVLDVSTRTNRGRLTGFYNTWLQAGFVLGPLVGALLVSGLGFRPAMLICAGLTATGLAVALVALPETALSVGKPTHIKQGTRSKITWDFPPFFASQQRQALKKRVLRSANNLRLSLKDTWHRFEMLLQANQGLVTASGLLLMTQFAGEGVILSTVGLLLKQRFGESIVLGGLLLGVAAASGLLLSMRSVLSGITGPLAGRLSDTVTGRWPVITGSLVLGIAGFSLLFLAERLWVVVLGLALGAIGGGASLAVLAAYVGDLTPPGRQGVVMGAYATAGDVGSMAGPFLAFALVTVVDLQWVYLLCTITFLIGLWLIWRLRKSRLL